MRALYPEIEPFDHGVLHVGDGPARGDGDFGGLDRGGAVVRGIRDDTSNTLLPQPGGGSSTEQDSIIVILIGLRTP